MALPAGWQRIILRRLGAPPTPENLRFLNAWHAAEGGGDKNAANFNPLNTTQGARGAGSINSVGVKSYRNAMQGLTATVQTLLNGHYDHIVQDLRSGRASAAQLGTDVAHSPWGTGSGVLHVLGSGAVSSAAATPSGGGAPGASAASGGGVPGLAQLLLQQAGETAQGHLSDPSSLLQLAQMRQQLGAAQQAFGPQPAPTGGDGKGGINELFYDPLGGIKHDKQIGAIGHHSDHVHIALSTLAAQLAAEAHARAAGLHVGEEQNSDFHNVHAANSYHNRNFKGTKYRMAADVSGDPRQMAAFYRWVQSRY